MEDAALLLPVYRLQMLRDCKSLTLIMDDGAVDPQLGHRFLYKHLCVQFYRLFNG